MLNKFFLKRIASIQAGTFGVLLEGSVPFALTLEPPWKDNQPFVSCIPANAYVASLTSSPKFGNTYQLIDVPGRTHILFHKGNKGANTKGCILIAEQFGTGLEQEPIVTASSAGFYEFMQRAGGQDIDLIISDYY